MSIKQERKFLREGETGYFKFNIYEDSAGPYALVTHPEIKKPIVARITKKANADLRNIVDELRSRGLSLVDWELLANDIIRTYREAKRTE